MVNTLKSIAVAGGLSLFAMTSANAAIIGAVDATIDAGGPGFGSISDTFDQSGLSANYVSGVTDFLSFVTSTTHNYFFSGFEWFSTGTAATVTYDLGAVTAVDALALWNEDASGIGNLDLSVSSDGVNFSSLVSSLSPTSNAPNVDYGAEVFSFAATSFQFIRFDMSGCPQPGGTGFNACAIGEVAFNTADVVSAVPVPAGLPLLLTGLGAFGLMRRRKKA